MVLWRSNPLRAGCTEGHGCFGTNPGLPVAEDNAPSVCPTDLRPDAFLGDARIPDLRGTGSNVSSRPDVILLSDRFVSPRFYNVSLSWYSEPLSTLRGRRNEGGRR